MKQNLMTRHSIQTVLILIATVMMPPVATSQTRPSSITPSPPSSSAKRANTRLRTLTEPQKPRFPITDRVWPAKVGGAHVCLWKNDKLAAVSFTIDDNCQPDHAWWTEQGRKYDWSFTWFTISGMVGGTSRGFYGDWKDFAALLSEGHDVQSHSVTHMDPKRGYTDIKDEYAPSVQQLEENLPGNRVTTIAYPGGPLMHENDHELASQIFIAARGTVGLINLANATNYNNVNSVSMMAFETENWADVKNLIDPKGYQAGKYLRGWYCCHYHGLKPDAKTKIVKAMDYIKQHEEDLWVGTFREVAMYGQQRDTTAMRATATSRQSFSVELRDHMDDRLFAYPLTVKLRVPDHWKQAEIKQGDRSSTANVIHHAGGTYLLLPVIPDAGKAIVTETQADLHAPAEAPVESKAPVDAEAINGRVFYVDPVQGNRSGDGSKTKPWHTLEEVFADGQIESQELKNGGKLDGPMKVKNPGAPVKAGDALKLLSGDHGTVAARGYHNRATIRIEALAGNVPELGGFHLQGASKWHLKGVTFRPGKQRRKQNPEKSESLVHFQSHAFHGPVNEIVIEDLTLFSATDTSEWTAKDWLQQAVTGIEVTGSNLIIRNNTLKNMDFGILAVGNDVLAEGNTIEHYCGDGMRGGGDRVVFQNNTIKWSYDVDDNHDDAIQFYREGGGSSEVVICGNRIDSYRLPGRPLTHAAQGIGAFNGPYRDWVVENNVVVVANHHGISLYEANNARIVNNTVLDITEEVDSWILLNDCTRSLIRNNLAASFNIIRGTDVVSENNLKLTPRNRDALFSDWKNGDFRLRPGSKAIDAGNPDHAPVIDLLGRPRPAGSAPDMGAYEFQ